MTFSLQRFARLSGATLFAICGAFLIASDVRADPLVRTFAGSGAFGTGDGQGAASTFMMPTGIARDTQGNLIVSDAAAQRIRLISPEGAVSTLAGSGEQETRLGFVGGYVDGIASKARFNHPSGVAVDRNSVIYVSDTLNHCIRKIDRRGIVSTYAGSLEAGSVDGGRLDARFVRPQGLALDRAGNLYVADPGSGLRKVSASGIVSTLDRGTTANNVSPGRRGIRWLRRHRGLCGGTVRTTHSVPGRIKAAVSRRSGDRF